MQIEFHRSDPSSEGHTNLEINDRSECEDTKNVIVNTIKDMRKVTGEEVEEDVTHHGNAEKCKKETREEDHPGVLRI